MTSIQNDPLGKEYWNNRYINKDHPWDIGYPSPPLTNYIDQLNDTSMKILIPGSGSGYEVDYLLNKGFSNISIVDISEAALASIHKRIGPGVNYIHEDFFKLEGQYDLILEQTFFCALNPELRSNYVESAFNLLVEGGKIAGVLFNRSFENSPPFGGSKAEYQKLFSNHFTVLKLEPCYNSIPARAGNELFFIFQKLAK